MDTSSLTPAGLPIAVGKSGRWLCELDGMTLHQRNGKPTSVSVMVNVEADEQHIAALGSPLLPQEAQGFFPDLDIDKYKRDE